MIYGAILAGGVGQRMKFGDMPKQFLELNGKPILMHTLEKMLFNNRFDKIYIGIHVEWLDRVSDMIDKMPNKDERIKIVTGGTDRNGTIFAIINDIEENDGIKDEDIIVTHDAVRPFVTHRIIEENIDATEKYGACDTVVPAVDTIVKSLDNEFIVDVPPRKQFYQGQTPQSFKINLFRNSFKKLSDEQAKTLTDACSVLVHTGERVRLVEGETLNFKITTVSDYQMATAMLGSTALPNQEEL